jgi:hypothetical protein
LGFLFDVHDVTAEEKAELSIGQRESLVFPFYLREREFSAGGGDEQRGPIAGDTIESRSTLKERKEGSNS